MSEKLTQSEAFPSPEEVVANVLLEGMEDWYQGIPTKHMRQKAQKITNALRANGWRIIR